MINYLNSMNQDAIYYPPTGEDRYGTDTYGAGRPLKVRWQQKSVLFRNYENVEMISDAVVYCSIDVEPRGKLSLGSTVDVTKAKRIQSVQTSPSLGGQSTLVKALL